MYEVSVASLRSSDWLTEILPAVFADSTYPDVLNTDCDRHWTTPSTFAHERVTYAPCHLAVQRVDHGEADRISGSR